MDVNSDHVRGVVLLAETASLGLVPIQAVIWRPSKNTWRDSRVGDPTLQMVQEEQGDTMGPHFQGETDGPPHGEIHSMLDQCGIS